MPRSIASRTDRMGLTVPPIEIVPESGCRIPPSIFIRVDFPAPFSPINATISPLPTRRSTESSALTPGNTLVIDSISIKGDVMGGSSVAAAKLVYSFGEFVDAGLVDNLGRHEYLFIRRNI